MNEKLKLWKNMTDAEKGALLLAHHERKVIEGTRLDVPDDWRVTVIGLDHIAYRVRPEPKIEKVVIDGEDIRFKWCLSGHKMTFNLVDGIPDCSSIKMEKM
jgi:hypothetical protein